MASIPTAASADSSTPKRPLPADAGGNGGSGPLRDDENADLAASAKRRRTAVSAETAMPAVDAAALAQENAVLKAAVASGKAREAALGQRVAEVEADNARLSIEVATLRKRPRLPEPPAALQQLVRMLGAHERDLRDRIFELACMPRYLAKCAGDLPPDPAGVLGTFMVTVPLGTIVIAGDAFRDCAGLAQVTLPATVTVIEGGGSFLVGAFSGCSSLRAITLPPNLTEIGEWAFYQCTSLSEITLPPTLTEIGCNAFLGCTSLSEITLPAGPVRIGPNAFHDCPGTPRPPPVPSP